MPEAFHKQRNIEGFKGILPLNNQAASRQASRAAVEWAMPKPYEVSGGLAELPSIDWVVIFRGKEFPLKPPSFIISMGMLRTSPLTDNKREGSGEILLPRLKLNIYLFLISISMIWGSHF